jgi:hypothetical protein
MSSSRWRIPALAELALLSVLCNLALPVLERHRIGEGDDVACRAVSRLEGATTEVSAPALRDRQPEHCAVCHMQRDLRGALHVRTSAFAAPPPVSVARDAATAPILLPAASATASRAPPFTL